MKNLIRLITDSSRDGYGYNHDPLNSRPHVRYERLPIFRNFIKPNDNLENYNVICVWTFLLPEWAFRTTTFDPFTVMRFRIDGFRSSKTQKPYCAQSLIFVSNRDLIRFTMMSDISNQGFVLSADQSFAYNSNGLSIISRFEAEKGIPAFRQVTGIR